MSSKEKDIPNFSLTSSSQSFSTRSDDIFANLDVLEKKHNDFQKIQASSQSLEVAGVIKCDPIEQDEIKGMERNSHRQQRRRGPVSISRYRGESGRHRLQNHQSRRPATERNLPKDGFRRPNPYRPKKVPDFKKNPEKYTCYSLDDVSESDMSEKANKRAALDFLFERKNEREKQERLAAGLPAEEVKFECETAACSKGLISFSRKREIIKMESDDKLNCSGSDTTSDKFGDRFEEEGREDVSSSVDCGSINDTGTEMDGNKDNDHQPKESESFKFKSRKNVRKHIRARRDSDDSP